MHLLFNGTAIDDIDLITRVPLMLIASSKRECGFSIFETIPHIVSSEINKLVNYNALETDVIDKNTLIINGFVLGDILNILCF